MRRPNGCALAASESVPHSVSEITVLLHLDAKIAPISLVSCTRVLGLGVHSCDGAALSGWVCIQPDALDQLLFDMDMRHCSLLGHCSK